MTEYIERKLLKKRFLKDLDWLKKDIHDEYSRALYDCCESDIDLIDEIPAADVAPVVHGKWISWAEADNYIPSPNRYECSVCHDAAQVLVSGFEMLSFYCPNCGAKMDGGVSE